MRQWHKCLHRFRLVFANLCAKWNWLQSISVWGGVGRMDKNGVIPVLKYGDSIFYQYGYT